MLCMISRVCFTWCGACQGQPSCVLKLPGLVTAALLSIFVLYVCLVSLASFAIAMCQCDLAVSNERELLIELHTQQGRGARREGEQMAYGAMNEALKGITASAAVLGVGCHVWCGSAGGRHAQPPRQQGWQSSQPLTGFCRRLH